MEPLEGDKLKEDERTMYRLLGTNIKTARESRMPRLSQDNLSKAVGLTRASIVNIEAGRQHPSLHVLWRIASVLQVQVQELIPIPDDLISADGPFHLDAESVAAIEEAASNDLRSKKLLTDFVAKAKQSSGRARS